LCTRKQIIDGQWVPEHLDEAPYRPETFDERCIRSLDDLRSESGWDTHKWVPNALVDAASSKWNSSNSTAAACHFTR
jgi:hypothetical protein